MDFGERNPFAIHLELNSDPGGAWLFGRFCYWIGGKQVGDYEQGTSLRDVFLNLKWIVHDCGNRRGDRLCHWRPEELFELFDGWKLYLVECETGDVFVYRHTGTDRKTEMFKAPTGSFDKVLQETYVYWEQVLSEAE